MKKIIIIFFLFLSPLLLYSHSGDVHVKEILDVFGFEENTELETWVKFISQTSIDDWQNFYSTLQNKYNFRKIGVGEHRVLFHWGYDSQPWNDVIEEKLDEHCYSNDLNLETYIRIFKTEFKTENEKRKKKVDNETMRLFGVHPNDGSIEAEYVKFFRNMVYNLHILGDYTTTNIDGLLPLDSVVLSINKEIKRLEPKLNEDGYLFMLRDKRLTSWFYKITSLFGKSAPKLGEYLINSLTDICPENFKNLDIATRNETINKMFVLLKKDMPLFIMKARGGAISAKKKTVKKWLEERGFLLKNKRRIKESLKNGG